MKEFRDPFENEIMRMGVDHRFRVRFQGHDLFLRPLASSEMVRAYGNVAEHMARLPTSKRTDIEENTWRAREFLKLASTTFGKEDPQITDVHLDAMTNKQILALYKEWQSVEERINPDIETIPAERFDELIELIKKNPKEDWDSQLTELSFTQLKRLVLYFLTNGD